MSLVIPPAEVLLEAAAEYLEQELLPSLDGYHRLHTRIAVNTLKTVLREQRLSADHAAQDARAIAAVLGGHADQPRALALELSDRLRDGTLALDTPGLVECLRATLRRQLAVDSPKWVPGSGGPTAT